MVFAILPATSWALFVFGLIIVAFTLRMLYRSTSSSGGALTSIVLGVVGLLIGFGMVICAFVIPTVRDSDARRDKIRQDLADQGYQLYSLSGDTNNTATVGKLDNDNCQAVVTVVRNKPTGQYRVGVVTKVNGENQLVELKDLPILTEARGC